MNESKTVKDRLIEILAWYNDIVWEQQIETSSALMAVNVPPGSIRDDHLMMSYLARISNGLSFRPNSWKEILNK